jgi:hypothetical protein
VLGGLLGLAVALGAACSPEPFSPPLGQNERLLLDERGEQPLEELPLTVQADTGEAVGTLEAGQARKGWTLFFRARQGEESLLWGVDTVGELYLISQTLDGSLVRLYWYTPGLFGSNAMVTQLHTDSGETLSRRAPKDSWTEAVKQLRGSG